VRLQASASSLYSLHTRLLSGPSIGRIAPIGPAPTTAQLGNCLISTIPVIFLRLNTDTETSAVVFGLLKKTRPAEEEKTVLLILY
jgi:hypothetical protein